MNNQFKIPLMRNAFIEEKKIKKELANFVLNCDRFSMGNEVRKFEENFASFTNSKYAVMVNSGGSANLLMLQVLKNQGKINTGDNIAYTSLTWSTNIFPIIQLGFNPIPIDVDVNTLNCSLKSIENTIKNHDIKCLFLTNVLGFASDLIKVKKLCYDNNVTLIEDNCESLGSRFKDNSLTGRHGVMSSHSFFIAHHMSTIEGGMIITDDFDIYESLKMSRANGWDRDLSKKTQDVLRKKHEINSDFYAKYTFYDLGYNVRPTEISGFLGNQQIQYLNKTIELRSSNSIILNKKIETLDYILPLKADYMSLISNFAHVFIFNDKDAMKKVYQNFVKNRIEIRPIIAGNMVNQPFYSKYNLEKIDLPGAQFIHKNGFYCGNYPEMNEDDLKLINKSLDI